MWRMCAKARCVEQTVEDVARVVQKPLPGFNSITVTQATYREVTRLAKELCGKITVLALGAPMMYMYCSCAA